MHDLPTGTATFVMTDIVGSARLWEAHRSQMRAAVIRHNELALQFLDGSSGQVLKIRGEGDSVFAVFVRAADALVAACALQAALQAEDWPPSTPLKVRIAVHSGEAELVDGDYLGDPPNRCSRLRAICHGGQILTTQVTREIVRDELPAGIALRSLGRHRLRDLRHADQVYQVEGPGLALEFPALDSFDQTPNNLPVQLTSFVGRDRELERLAELAPRTRLLTLVGEGGSGKTRLALQFCADQVERFPQGVWLANLGSLTSGVELVREIAAVLGVQERPDIPLAQSLVERIGGADMLVVLDNCERLIQPVAELAEVLLLACRGLKIVTTSREALRCRGEMRYPVPGLDLPDDGRSDRHTVQRSDAVRLFVERATFSNPEFSVTDENVARIARICGRLDGNALAIELAAAHLESESLVAIERRLFEMLGDGPRTAPERQQSVDLAIAWSYNPLPESHRLLFDRLAVFAGGWSAEAARAVTAGNGLAPDAVDRLTADLVRKSLVARSEQPDGSLRYEMHGTIRNFAWRRLSTTDALNVIEERHVQYFMSLAETAEVELKGPEQRVWLERLDRESDNIRGALHAIQVHGLIDFGLRLTGALWRYWFMRGLTVEGVERLQQVLTLTEDTDVSPARAKALHGAGTLAIYVGDLIGADAILRKAQALWLALDDEAGEKNTLNNLGIVAYQLGDYEQAKRYYTRYLDLCRALGDTWGEATGLGNLADVAYATGDLEQAAVVTTESLAIRRRVGDRSAEASSLLTLGLVAFDRGDFAAATERFETCLSAFTALKERRGIATCKRILGLVAHEQLDFTSARRLYLESLSIAQEIGERLALVRAYANLGRLAFDEQLPEEARQYYELLAPLVDIAISEDVYGDVAEGAGRLAMSLGDLPTAERRLRQGLDSNRKKGNPVVIAQFAEAIAALAVAERRYGDGLVLACAAAALRSRAGTPLSPARTLAHDAVVAACEANLVVVEREEAQRRGSGLTLQDTADFALAITAGQEEAGLTA
jgi:predicted ATPase/class 3 adenylate cyclase/Tfp pilus assembly protein PilF